MCGGKPEVFERARPVLEKLSSTLRHIGAVGRAAQVKALVNMVMNINTAGLAEGLAVGDALGLDLALLREVFAQTGANSQVLRTDGEDMQNRDHACFFSAAHAAKDSGIALKLGKSQGLTLPLARGDLETIRTDERGGPGRSGQIGHCRTDLQEPTTVRAGSLACFTGFASSARLNHLTVRPARGFKPLRSNTFLTYSRVYATAVLLQ